MPDLRAYSSEETHLSHEFYSDQSSPHQWNEVSEWHCWCRGVISASLWFVVEGCCTMSRHTVCSTLDLHYAPHPQTPPQSFPRGVTKVWNKDVKISLMLCCGIPETPHQSNTSITLTQQAETHMQVNFLSLISYQHTHMHECECVCWFLSHRCQCVRHRSDGSEQHLVCDEMRARSAMRNTWSVSVDTESVFKGCSHIK